MAIEIVGYVNSLLLKMAIEIVDFPIHSMVDLSHQLCKRLPEGTMHINSLLLCSMDG